jgi:hypothetical protein
MTQSDHQSWNNSNYPETLELCCMCNQETGNCKEDNIIGDNGGPYCRDCAIGAGILEIEQGN